MRILLATDGSESAGAAAQLVLNTPWPPATTVHIVSVVPPVGYGFPGMPEVVISTGTINGIVEAAVGAAHRAMAVIASQLRTRGQLVEEHVVEGRPASEIVDLAASLHPDLVVVGSHGRGRVASLLLGSVSAEVVETAPCSVLVVRTPEVSRLIVADDGSTDAAAAVRLVERMPGFHSLPVEVVTVEDQTPGWYGWLGANSGYQVQAFEDGIAADRQWRAAMAARDVAALKNAGLAATTMPRRGDPGHEIVAAATDFDADLIVMGTRGQTGLTRLLVGSVTRNVLQRAPCSVLVVRPGAPA